ncbi:hypothetical protein HK101_008899 [Irineochytrium annulatum]|nr:hypothetical protein HK101_008899 [Irineochytrium annulatum]
MGGLDLGASALALATTDGGTMEEAAPVEITPVAITPGSAVGSAGSRVGWAERHRSEGDGEEEEEEEDYFVDARDRTPSSASRRSFVDGDWLDGASVDDGSEDHQVEPVVSPVPPVNATRAAMVPVLRAVEMLDAIAPKSSDPDGLKLVSMADPEPPAISVAPKPEMSVIPFISAPTDAQLELLSTLQLQNATLQHALARSRAESEDLSLRLHASESLLQSECSRRVAAESALADAEDRLVRLREELVEADAIRRDNERNARALSGVVRGLRGDVAGLEARLERERRATAEARREAGALRALLGGRGGGGGRDGMLLP